MRNLRRMDDPNKAGWGKAAYLLALALMAIGAACAIGYAFAKDGGIL